MERPRTFLTRRDFLKASVGAAGLVLVGCNPFESSPYAPAIYTVNLPAGVDRYEAMQSEFAGVTPVVLTLRPDASIPGNTYSRVWRANSAELISPGGYPSKGRITFLTEVDLQSPQNDSNRIWRAFLFNTDSTKKESYEFEVGYITVGDAGLVIKGKEMLAPEDMNNLAVEVDFADAAEKLNVARSLRST